MEIKHSALHIGTGVRWCILSFCLLVLCMAGQWSLRLRKSGSKWCSGLIDTHGKVGLCEGCVLPWSLHKKMDLNSFSCYAGLCDLLRL